MGTGPGLPTPTRQIVVSLANWQAPGVIEAKYAALRQA